VRENRSDRRRLQRQAFGLIRRQQPADYGHASGVDLHNPDLAALAGAVGCSYFLIEGDMGIAMTAVARQSESVGRVAIARPATPRPKPSASLRVYGR
jgi:thiamine pyrophosphate-dependent acetolactate synthase large subunit-like protein